MIFLCDKKREYGEQIREVEHGSFTPLVFSTCGGMGQEALVVVKKFGRCPCQKRNESYSHVVSWMRCCLAFSLARSAICCVRGSHSTRCRTDHQAPPDMVQAEAQMEQP